MMSESGLYRMPAISIGAIVLWYPNGARSVPPLPAIVTRINPRSLGLSIFAPDTHNLMLRDGVRHLDDPEFRKDPVRMGEEGGWDYTEESKALGQTLTDLGRKGSKASA
jgi:hypothetical protein